MNGPDHYREAERLIARLTGIVLNNDGSSPEATFMLAEAQVHATLALAAATALTSHMSTYDDEPEIQAWVDAAGVQPS